MTDQRTPEWFAARLGKVTASRIADVMSSGAGRETYMAQLICERMTKQPMESFSSDAMQHGTDTEPEARRAYEARTGEFVDEVGLILHPSIENAGASPDGLVGEEGLVEIKCPKTNTHINTLLDDKVPTKYANYQIQWQMACTGRKWCDFVSYDPRMPSLKTKLFVKRVERDDKRIAELEEGVRKFLAELDERINKLKELDL